MPYIELSLKIFETKLNIPRTAIMINMVEQKINFVSKHHAPKLLKAGSKVEALIC